MWFWLYLYTPRYTHNLFWLEYEGSEKSNRALYIDYFPLLQLVKAEVSSCWPRLPHHGQFQCHRKRKYGIYFRCGTLLLYVTLALSIYIAHYLLLPLFLAFCKTIKVYIVYRWLIRNVAYIITPNSLGRWIIKTEAYLTNADKSYTGAMLFVILITGKLIYKKKMHIFHSP